MACAVSIDASTMPPKILKKKNPKEKAGGTQQLYDQVVCYNIISSMCARKAKAKPMKYR